MSSCRPRFLSRGRDEAVEAERRTVEAAVSAYYLDPANQQRWPTLLGEAGDDFVITSTAVNIKLLRDRNYLRDIPSTASTVNDSEAKGGLTWYVQADGKVTYVEGTPTATPAPTATTTPTATPTATPAPTPTTPAGTNWVALSPGGTAPTARRMHSAVYDSSTDRMILFGGHGNSNGTELNDLHVLGDASGLSTPSWSGALSPDGTAPSTRYGHSAAYDPDSNKMIVFAGAQGGIDAGTGTDLNDVYILSNANNSSTPSWSQLSTTGGPPTARAKHAAAYDSSSNGLMVFGGNSNIGNCGGELGDFWLLTNADGSAGGGGTWHSITPAADPTHGSPAARRRHTLVYDSTNNRLILFGGNPNCASPFNDVWVLSNANDTLSSQAWTKLSPSGTAPTARADHSAIYDSGTNRMTIYGGTSNSSEVWVLTNANGLGGTPSWTQLSPSGSAPAGRENHSAVYRQAAGRMIVFGGGTSSGLVNDVFVLTNADGS